MEVNPWQFFNAKHFLDNWLLNLTKSASLVAQFSCDCMFLNLVESNHDHLERFQDFQDRNILRKLNLGLNQVPLTASELKDAGIDKLKEISEKEKQESTKYVFKIPEQPHEFPHLSTSITKVYPLPISHENQCKTLGLGRNLDLFSEEFGFESNKIPKFLPLKRSKKEFDLELGYTRFAFLKAMDRHKEQQKNFRNYFEG